jgi:hypothetical protein
MSRISEGFLFQYNQARNPNESKKVVEDVLKYLKQKTEVLDNILSEISKSKIMIKLTSQALAATSPSERTMTTKKSKVVPEIVIQTKPADIKKIAKTWDDLVELDDVISTFESSILPRHVSMYKSIPGLSEQMKNVNKILDQCRKTKAALLNELRATGNKLIPRDIKFIINKVKEELETKLVGRYERCDIMVYPKVVKFKDKHVLAYFCYIQMTELKDDEDWVKKVFDIVIVAIALKDSGFKYQIHTSDSHNLPPELDLTDGDWQDNVKGVVNKVITKLTDIHSLNLLRPQSLPFSEQDLKKSGLKSPDVKKIYIDGNILKLELMPKIETKEKAYEIGARIFADVKRMFKIGKNGSLSYRPVPEGRIWTLNFVLNTPGSYDSAGGNIAKKFNNDRSLLEEFAIKMKLDKEAQKKLEDSYRAFLYRQYRKIAPQELNISDKDDVTTHLRPASRVTVEPKQPQQKSLTEKTKEIVKDAKVKKSLSPEAKRKRVADLLKKNTSRKNNKVKEEDIDIDL